MINPIQTQAVTYIVQRMTLLASFFFITGIYCYLLARLAGSKRQRILMFVCCAASLLLGMAAKENAALLPLTIIAIEAIFFQDLGNPLVRRKVFAFIAVRRSRSRDFGRIHFSQGRFTVRIFGLW